MVVDGRALAEDIFTRIREEALLRERSPRLGILTCAPNFETKKYLALKEKKAADVGIKIEILELLPESTTDDFIAAIKTFVERTDGIIVQLPLPSHVDARAVLPAIPATHDVDALNSATAKVLSPVVGAIKIILEKHNITPKDMQVTIIGSGRLVGVPVSQWFVAEGAAVSVVTRDTNDIPSYTRNADIVVCGAGVPGLLTPDMVRDGAVILDAGTSEEGGVLRGDADPRCEEKASVFTPVPGGIGPMTIAVLLHNLIVLSRE